MEIIVLPLKEKHQPKLMVDNEDLIGKYEYHQAFEQIKLLNSINYKGYSDWRLPTKEELNLLFKNKNKIGNFNSSFYWSSSEASNDFAWIQSFGSGNQDYSDKTSVYRVRCVRDI